MRLFVTRGLQGLADTRNGRVAVAYGFGEQPALGLAVQEALDPLHLAYEAVLPGFNRYAGAEAIGAEAALYVLRPTRRSISAAQATTDDPSLALYTQGFQSVETAARPLADEAADRILGLAAGPGEGALLVGGGWPVACAGQRLPLAALMAAPLPAGLRGRTTVINLYPGFGSLVFRALLAASGRKVAIVCRNNVPWLRDEAGQHELARLIEPKYRITRLLRSTPEPDMAVILAEEPPAGGPGLAGGEQVARYVYARAHGKLGNAWREGLIRLWRSRGQELTKRDARGLIESVTARPDLLDRCLVDLPVHLFPPLLDELERSEAAVPQT
jgi:N4-bis(aminopropyl)spermidine synthase